MEDILQRFDKLNSEKKIAEDLYDAVRVLIKHIEECQTDVGTKGTDVGTDVGKLEIETRLGFCNDDGSFDSDISLEFYNKIIERLKSCKSWDSVITKTYVDYSKESLRLSISNDGLEQCCIRKVKMKQFNFRYENSPFDVRVSFCNEKPVSVGDFPTDKLGECYSRKKNRTSFTTGYINFDMTEVRTTSNGISKISYEAEIEINRALNDKKTPQCPIYLANDILLKTRDLIDMCEVCEDKREMTLISSKTDFERS